VSAKFNVKKTNAGFSFNLVAPNGEIIGRSEVYNSKNACLNGVESVRKNSVAASVEDQTVKDFTTEKNPKFEIFLDKAGEFRFRLKATNGEIILASEGYTAKQGCKNGIESVQKNAPNAALNFIE